MVAIATISPYYKLYTDVKVSRVNKWQPKIYAAVKSVSTPILTKPTLSEAIQAAQSIPLITDLADTIKDLYKDTGAIMGAYAYQNARKQAKAKRKAESKALLPIGYNEQLINDIIAYYQTSLFNGAVFPISESIRDYILAKLIEAQQTGDSLSNVAEALKPYLASKAMLVTRTETVKAMNYGAKKGAQLTGYDMNKVWLSAQDYRTRRTPRDVADHLHMNNVEVGMDELFKVRSKTDGYDMMDRPGDSSAPANQVANCRCCLAFKVL